MKNFYIKHITIIIFIFSCVSIVIAREDSNKEPLMVSEYKEIEIEYRKWPGLASKYSEEVLSWGIKGSPNLVIIYPERSLLGKTPITLNLDKSKTYKISALAFHFAYGIYHVLAKDIKAIQE